MQGGGMHNNRFIEMKDSLSYTKNDKIRFLNPSKLENLKLLYREKRNGNHPCASL